jgi:hypothetical protein
MLCGIGPDGEKRDPMTVPELRQFCGSLRKWLSRREEYLLSLSQLGKQVPSRRNYKLDVFVVWEHLSRIAGESDYEPLPSGPYTRARAIAALDRVIVWCNRQKQVTARPAGEEEAGSLPSQTTPARPLNDTERRIIEHCRERAHTAERIARHLNLTCDHIRHVCARLVQEGRLRKTPDGYRAV